MKIAKRVFLCEGKIDDGGYLRVVTLDEKGFECIEIKTNLLKRNKPKEAYSSSLFVFNHLNTLYRIPIHFLTS